MRWVRWMQWGNEGMVGYGQMPISEVQKNLQKFELAAKELLAKSNADHVVYGVKHYSDDGELESVRFYMQPMDNRTFQKNVASLHGVTVCALHRYN